VDLAIKFSVVDLAIDFTAYRVYTVQLPNAKL
jgi:hypothetical protein